MLCALVALLAAAAPAGGALAASDSTASDSSAHRRIVREFPPITVEAGRREDPGSIETVHSVAPRLLRGLPTDGLVGVLALQPGVVAKGEELHVRGGRTGDLALTVSGVPLNDPQSGRPMELPLLAIRSANLLAGGLDADHVGALAGELEVETESPTARPAAMARWITDGRLYGSYDAGLLRASTPLGLGGWGIVVAGEARLDDLALPSTRSRGRQIVLDANLGWRHDNRMRVWGKLASIEHPDRTAIEVFASRTVLAPYNPMFTFDGYMTPTGARGPFPYVVSDEPIDDTSIHYHAADHEVMTDERRIAFVATHRIANARAPLSLAAGLLRGTSLTSVGLTHDPGYIRDSNRLVWGELGSVGSDPFFAYLGDEQYYRDSESQRLFARADVTAAPGRRQRLKAGVGASYDEVRLREIDAILPLEAGPEPERSYHAWAPGGFAYVQHRAELGGLIWNAGLRLQLFTAGSQVDSSHTQWTWSPRIGFAYPASDKDAFSASYIRIHQDPERDLLYDNRVYNYNEHPLGNGALVPAEMISYQAAVRHLFDAGLSLQVGAFYRDVYGEPGVRNAPTPGGSFRLRYTSADEAHAGGVELALRRESRGGQRLDLAYTFMHASGTQSNPNGLQFGTSFGDRPLPLGTHALDWDVRHTIAASVLLHTRSEWSLSWSTRLASGAPWTPLYDTLGAEPKQYTDQSLINSRRLPWTENTDVAIRWKANVFVGFSAVLTVTNLFDERGERQVTLSGYPNPVINTLIDEYSGYHTQTGNDGGAYYDGGWIPVHDRRLFERPRSFRLGLEFGH